jgi:hypothetical protein
MNVLKKVALCSTVFLTLALAGCSSNSDKVAQKSTNSPKTVQHDATDKISTTLDRGDSVKQSTVASNVTASSVSQTQSSDEKEINQQLSDIDSLLNDTQDSNVSINVQ